MKAAKETKKTEVEKLYFIAIIPPSSIYDEAMELKMYFKEKYNSKASLNSPPHITLHMPFRWAEQEEKELEVHVEEFASQNTPVPISLNGFASFPPRVIFINVELTEEIRRLQKNLEQYFKRKLNIFNANYKELAFHPHLTLAFRDLKKPTYLKAWEEFGIKNYEAKFCADKIALLKHSGAVWQVYREYALRKSA